MFKNARAKIEFVWPEYYARLGLAGPENEVGKLCYQHDTVCERVEDVLMRLRKEEEEKALKQDNPTGKKSRVSLDSENGRPPLSPQQQQQQQQQQSSLVEWRKDNMKFFSIREGDQFNVFTPLLSGGGGHDFLVSCMEPHNPLKQVQIADLRGKHLVLYFARLPPDGGVGDEGFEKCYYYEDVLDIYHSLQGKLEIVFVGLRDVPQNIYHSAIAKMPWLALPYHNKPVRLALQQTFSIRDDEFFLPTPVLFSPDGIVLATNECTFRSYGSEAFPYTPAAIEGVDTDDQNLIQSLFNQQVSLTQLFGPTLTDSNGQEVNTLDLLQNKTMGLFFHTAPSLSCFRDKRLVGLWDSILTNDEDFVLIVDYSLAPRYSYAERGFKEIMGTRPWYAMSIRYGRKLSRALKVDVIDRDVLPSASGHFIVFEPNLSRVNYFALPIYDFLGVDAYPFSIEEAANLMVSKVGKTHRLDYLLALDAPLRRGNNNQQDDVLLSSIIEERIVLLFATHSSYCSGRFLPKLKRIYLDRQGGEDTFEVIYMPLDCSMSLSSFEKCIEEMPWLIHSFAPKFSESVLEVLFPFASESDIKVPAMAVFEKGVLVAKELDLAFKKSWNSEFPFVEVYSCEKEVKEEIVSGYIWDIDLVFPGILSKGLGS